MSLLTLINTVKPVDIASFLQTTLSPLPPSQQLDHLLGFLNSANDAEEILSHSVSHAWSYLVQHSLWSSRYSSLDLFRADIAYDTAILPFIERSNSNYNKLDRYIRIIKRNWHIAHTDKPLSTVLFSGPLEPPTISRRAVQCLGKFSAVCDQNQAVTLILKQTEARLDAGMFMTSRSTFVVAADIALAFTDFTKPLLPLLTEVSQLTTETPLTLLAAAAAAAAVRSTLVPPLAFDQSKPIGRPCHVCPPDILNTDLTAIKSLDNNSERLQLFGHVAQLGFDTLCHRHLRTFASLTVGLYNNMNHLVLTHRLARVNDSPSIEECRRENPDWFQESDRPESEADYLVVYRYPPIHITHLQIDPKAIFKRFAGTKALQTWDQDGTVIIPNIFHYLNQPDLMGIIDIDFDMYRHHYRPVPGRPKMGFLRNMIYGLTQQLVRQDPVWYALMVAARPDHNPNLVSYPYIARDPYLNEPTAFLHLDLNMREFIRSSQGANILSSSISLDEEQKDTCTLVVPGFHRHIHEWHKRRVTRGEDSTGTTTNCNHQYRPEDRTEWGTPVACPCPAFGLRLTRPEIIHGSTPKCCRRRRVIYAWHTGIQSDHLTLENPGTLNWEGVAACHRDLEAPARGVGGEIPTHSVPPFRFPAAIYLESSYPLGDALLARRRWDDPEVVLERNILLGPDHDLALNYVEEKRKKMVKKFRKAFSKLESVERAAFGENSFFLYQEQHGSDIEMQD